MSHLGIVFQNDERKRTFKFVIFQLQKYIYFLNLQSFPQSFFFFYIVSYQLDSLACTKLHLFDTNLRYPPEK